MICHRLWNIKEYFEGNVFPSFTNSLRFQKIVDASNQTHTFLIGYICTEWCRLLTTKKKVLKIIYTRGATLSYKLVVNLMSPVTLRYIVR